MMITIQRIYSDNKVTLGILTINNTTLFTLELPYNDNKRRISCIPKGKYSMLKRDGVKVGSKVAPYLHYHIQDVPNRDWILIHRGNLPKHTHGCILVGTAITIMNGELAVSNSKIALNILNDNIKDNSIFINII